MKFDKIEVSELDIFNKSYFIKKHPTLFNANSSSSSTNNIYKINVKDYGAIGDGSTDDTNAIALAKNSAGDNKNIYFPPGVYLANNLILDIPNQMWTGDNASIKKNSNGPLFLISTDNININNLTLDGNSSLGFTGTCITSVNVNNLEIHNNIIKNAQIFNLYLVNNSNFNIKDNKIYGSKEAGIFAEMGTVKGKILFNDIDTSEANSDGDCIQIHSKSIGKITTDITIIGNYCTPRAFGIEVGAFGGERPNNIIVSKNIIKPVVDSLGGISFDSVDKSSITNNIYNWNSKVISIAALETVFCRAIMLNENIINGGLGLQTGISGSRNLEDCIITDNIILGFLSTNSSISSGIHLSASTPDAINNNTISNNIINFLTTETIGRRGLWLQCNHSQAIVKNNLIANNRIIGDNFINSFGIVIEKNAGSLTGTVVPNNFISDISISKSIFNSGIDTILINNLGGPNPNPI